MPSLKQTICIAATSMTVLLGTLASAHAACDQLVEQFEAAMAAKNLDQAVGLEKQIYSDEVCNAKDVAIRQRLLTLELDLAADPAEAPATQTAALNEIRKPGTPLRSMTDAVGLADRLFKLRHFADSQEFYDRAIALAGLDTSLTDKQKSDLLGRAGAAKILANDDDQGRRPQGFAPSTRGPDGSIDGIYAPTLRGVTVIPLPLPINFVFASTGLTTNGEKTAAELLQVLQQQDVKEITLVGHTDPRGSADYNKKLSLARARAVADYLQHHGLKIQIKTVGKGSDAPFDPTILPYQPTQDEVWTLDRRVELIW